MEHGRRSRTEKMPGLPDGIFRLLGHGDLDGLAGETRASIQRLTQGLTIHKKNGRFVPFWPRDSH
jgi:hypothetical protein